MEVMRRCPRRLGVVDCNPRSLQVRLARVLVLRGLEKHPAEYIDVRFDRDFNTEEYDDLGKVLHLTPARLQ